MANAKFEKGREGIADGTVDLDTNTISMIAMVLTATDVGVKAITGATNASPIVITATAHGFANGDLVIIGGVGGNVAANGLWKIANQATNTFELQRPDGVNATGSGAYTSGGYAICLGPSAAGDHLDDFDGCRASGTTDQNLASKTVVNGVFDAADAVFTSVPAGAAIGAFAVYKDTGTGSTSRMIAILDGRQIVTCAATAATSATSIAVEALSGGIPNGTVLAFSNGQTATLSAVANAGDRTLTVSSLGGSVTAGSRADAPITGANLPITPNGGNITAAIANILTV